MLREARHVRATKSKSKGRQSVSNRTDDDEVQERVYRVTHERFRSFARPLRSKLTRKTQAERVKL